VPIGVSHGCGADLDRHGADAYALNRALPESEVGRVIVFDAKTRPVAAVLPLGSEPDLGAIRRATRVSSLHPASEERSSELTGYLFESIPPAGLPSFRVVVDRTLDRDSVLYFPGGEVRSVLKIRGTDLVKATNAVVAPISLPARRERAAL